MKKVFFTIILILGIGIYSCNKAELEWLIYNDYPPSWYDPYYNYNNEKIVILDRDRSCYHTSYGWNNNYLYISRSSQYCNYTFGPYYDNLLRSKKYLIFRRMYNGQLIYCNE